ncbi:6619_t:CDS:2, partial [Ambispora gerdemannii]
MFNARLVLRVRLGTQLTHVTSPTKHIHSSRFAKPYRVFDEGAKRFKSKKHKNNGTLNDTNVDKTSEPISTEEPILKNPPITEIANSATLKNLSASETPAESRSTVNESTTTSLDQQSLPPSNQPKSEPKETESEIKSTVSETTKKASGSYGKYILTIILLGVVGYGGAVYHSIHDEKFRKKFTTTVPGANQVVEYVDNLHRQGTFHHLRQQTAELTEKTVDFSLSVYDNLSRKISKTLKPAIEIETNQEGKTPSAAAEQNEKSSPLPLELDTKVSPSLAQEIRIFTSEEPIINELYQILDRLANIVKETDTSPDIILKAKEKLNELNERINSSKTKIYVLIEAALVEQEEAFNALLGSKEKSLLDNSEKEKQHLKDEFETNKQLLLKQHKDLTDELSRQARKHAEELRDILIREGVRMKKRWIREIKSRVEQERNGRLANLESLNLRLKELQNLSVQNADNLDDSIKSHRLWRAVYALKNAVNKPHRTPFANEVATLKEVASTDELVTAVLSTIDDSVSSTGIDSVSNLVARFAKVREAVRSASLVPENGGLLPHALSRVLYRFMFRKHGMMDGDDVEAVLARVEHHLKEHDLDKATRELNQLKGWPKTIASDWMRAARDHLEVQQAIQ